MYLVGKKTDKNNNKRKHTKKTRKPKKTPIMIKT